MASQWRRRDWIRSEPPNLLTGTLGGQDRIYGAPGEVPAYDWPNPLRARQPQENQGFVRGAAVQLIGQDRFFAANGQPPTYDWPNPRRPVPPPQADSQCNLLVGLLARPFAQTEWPNPLAALQPQENRGFTRPASVQLIGQDRFFGAAGQAPVYDHPNPQRPRYPVQPEPPPNLLATTFTVVVMPFYMTDWPNPQQARHPQENRGWVRGVSVQLIGQDRFYGAAGQPPAYDHPNPARPRTVPQADSVSSLLVGPLAVPFALTDWPNPARPRLPVQPDAAPNLLTTTAFATPRPFALADWPNPATPRQPQENQGFVRAANVQLIGKDQFFAAAGEAPVYDWPNPLRARQPVQPEPVPNLLTTTTFVAALPFALRDWPNPRAPRQPQENQGFVGAAPVRLIGLDTFFAGAGRAPVYDWPNPALPRYPVQPEPPPDALLVLYVGPPPPVTVLPGGTWQDARDNTFVDARANVWGDGRDNTFVGGDW